MGLVRRRANTLHQFFEFDGWLHGVRSVVVVGTHRANAAAVQEVRADFLEPPDVFLDQCHFQKVFTRLFGREDRGLVGLVRSRRHAAREGTADTVLNKCLPGLRVLPMVAQADRMRRVGIERMIGAVLPGVRRR